MTHQLHRKVLSVCCDRAEDDGYGEDPGEEPEAEHRHPALGPRQEAHQLEGVHHHDVPADIDTLETSNTYCILSEYRSTINDQFNHLS